MCLIRSWQSILRMLMRQMRDGIYKRLLVERLAMHGAVRRYDLPFVVFECDEECRLICREHDKINDASAPSPESRDRVKHHAPIGGLYKKPRSSVSTQQALKNFLVVFLDVPIIGFCSRRRLVEHRLLNFEPLFQHLTADNLNDLLQMLASLDTLRNGGRFFG